jgi:CubicO group peptidase (beta-lactamase class C family)
MAYVKNDTFDFAPGTSWRYNNSGYFLLGMILERLEKKPYADIMRDRFFKPLRMATADYCPNAPSDPRYAAGYNRDGPNLLPAQAIDLSHPYSAGALCMSVPDFLAWQTALTSGKVVRPATYVQMATSDSVGGKATEYGFGLAPGGLPGHRLIQHGGDIPGFSTQQLWFPDDTLRIVAFANTLGSNPDRLAMNMARAVFGMPLRAKAMPLVAVPLPAGERAKYEGRFLLARLNGGVLPLRVFIEGDALMSQAEGPGQGKIPLVYLGNDTFGANFDTTLRLTFVVENGRTTKLRLLQRGNTIEGPRDTAP